MLDGDEDFIEERPSSKRKREALINHDGDEFDDLSSLLGDDDGKHQARILQVILNDDGNSDSDGGGDQVAV